MADQSGYKHIKVNAGASDDVVIHAGARAEDSRTLEAANPAPHESANPAVTAAADQASAEVAGQMPADRQHKSDDAYQPTTLEDIESSKMPRTQMIVIAVAVAAIAAFAIWYVFFS